VIQKPAKAEYSVIVVILGLRISGRPFLISNLCMVRSENGENGKNSENGIAHAHL
jgi:hypothetical protein